jgi:ATPase subunit of ABC transporter with duplicated ATPase domains
MADVVAERSMAMMIVSHDRKLLEAISDQVLELQPKTNHSSHLQIMFEA